MAEFDRPYHNDLRSYSDFDRGYRNDYAAYGGVGVGGGGDRRLEIVKGSAFGANQTYTTHPPPPPQPPRAVVRASSSSSSSGAWCFGDPEMKRRRRVASYKVYSVEGKVKSSLRKGFRWIKGKCSEIIHGW